MLEILEIAVRVTQHGKKAFHKNTFNVCHKNDFVIILTHHQSHWYLSVQSMLSFGSINRIIVNMVLFYLQIQDDFWKRQIIFDKMRRIFRGRLSRSRSKGGIIGKIRFSLKLTNFSVICYPCIQYLRAKYQRSNNS